MRVLITGGAGFIGSHLADSIISEGHDVTILDNLSTGEKSNVPSGASFVQGNLLDNDLVENLVSDSDVIYHLGAGVGVKYIMENTLNSIRYNTQGTENILESACKGNKKVFIASSSEVYGKTTHVPFKEDDDRLVGPTSQRRWSYACTKALDEFLALAYYRERGLPIVIGRYFNVCGPRQASAYGMVVPRFIKSALSGKPLTVYGDGTDIRTFTYVSDAVRATRLLMDKVEGIGEIFNIGGSESIQIKELAQKIIDISGSNSIIKYIPYNLLEDREGSEDMKIRIPDTTKIHSTFGFEPEYSLDEMLKRMIDDAKKKS